MPSRPAWWSELRTETEDAVLTIVLALGKARADLVGTAAEREVARLYAASPELAADRFSPLGWWPSD